MCYKLQLLFQCFTLYLDWKNLKERKGRDFERYNFFYLDSKFEGGDLEARDLKELIPLILLSFPPLPPPSLPLSLPPSFLCFYFPS